MKRYNVTVNGKTYDVAVEESANGSAPASQTVAQAAPVATASATPTTPTAPATPAAQTAAPQVDNTPVDGGHEINAPMPGTILDVKVSVGDSVSHGQALVVLEAMKMENDICSDKEGTVAAIRVNKGDTIDTGAVLVVLK